MKLLRGPKHILSDKLSLSSKILLRRLYAWFIRPTQRTTSSLKSHTVQPWNADGLLCVKEALAARLPPSKHPGRIQTSIIIPVFNKVDFTFQCICSLLPEIDLDTTEVIVVNNASTDQTSEALAYFGDFMRVIDNNENQGFVDACNQGAAAATGKYLLFLNNDTIVMSGWLTNLLQTMNNESSVGAVGSMFVYPNGRIQEAGGIVWKTGEAHHYGWGESPEDRKYNFVREVDYCSAASLLVRKNLFDRLGGFDRRYAPAYYEDVDLCFGVRSLGYKVVIQPLSRVVHYEGATAGQDTTTNTKHYQVINHKKFAEKWRQVLDEQFENDPALAEEAANRKRGPRVIVFDDRVPTPDRDAGSARMVNILKVLAQIGRPVFVPMKPLPDSERLLWKEGIETANVVDYVRLIKNRDFRVAILSRPEIATALIRSIRRADRKIKIVFDMVDAHFIRLGREHKITGNQELAIKARRYKDLELKLVRASDQVWCASSADKTAVSMAGAEERVVVVPTIHPLQDRVNPPEDREGLLFIGSFSHRPNSDAVHYFMREIYPLIQKGLPSVTFYIVGSNSCPEINAYQSATVNVMGYVPDIDPLLRSARVFVAPLRFGAGVNGKIGEALSYGLPVVTTSIGAEGIGLTSGENAMIADDPAKFADSVLHVYRDRDLWQRLSENGYNLIEDHFTPQVVGRTIKEGLKKLGVFDL